MSLTLKTTGWGGVGHLARISRCSPWSRPLMFGSAKSEHPRLTNGEIILEEFQPMWSQSTNVTDGRMNRQMTCDRKTALCTKVLRPIKIAFATSFSCWTASSCLSLSSWYDGDYCCYYYFMVGMTSTYCIYIIIIVIIILFFNSWYT